MVNNINIAITREEIEKDDIPHQDDDISHNKKKFNIITLPTIISTPLNSKDIANSIKKIERGFYDYYIFLSARSVDFFFNLIKNEKNTNAILQNILEKNNINNNNFIAIGPKTKKAIEKYNLKANLADPYNKEEFSLNSIIEFLDQLDKGNVKEKIKILMPRSTESQKSDNIITKTYRNLSLDQIFFYETREFNKIEKSDQWNKFKNLIYYKEIHSIIFTSPSTVRAFFKIIIDSATNTHRDNRLPSLLDIKNEQEIMNLLGIKLIISIGPKTSDELKKRNIIFLESNEHTVKGALKYLFKRL